MIRIVEKSTGNEVKGAGRYVTENAFFFLNFVNCFEDGDGIDNLTLVHNGTGTVDSANNMRHTGLVGAECSQVAWNGGVVVLGERTDATRVVLGALLGEEPKVTVPGGFELTVRHGD